MYYDQTCNSQIFDRRKSNKNLIDHPYELDLMDRRKIIYLLIYVETILVPGKNKWNKSNNEVAFWLMYQLNLLSHLYQCLSFQK